jgi:hypothetical protein
MRKVEARRDRLCIPAYFDRKADFRHLELFLDHTSDHFLCYPHEAAMLL